MPTPSPTIVLSAPKFLIGEQNFERLTPGVNWDEVDPTEYPAQSISLTWSWGTEPAEVNVVYTSESPANLGSAVKLTVGNYFFSGICQADVPLDSSRGRNRQLTFLDYRKWLDWDKAYCLFNQIDDRLIGGVRRRRYRHILPGHHFTMYATWTDTPYSAASIMQLVLLGPGIETPWSTGYLNAAGVLQDNGTRFTWHPNLALPVYNVDCMAGKSVAVLFSEIATECGLLFTHRPQDRPANDRLFHLMFAQKGVDGPDVTPPANSDDRRSGTQLSGNPTRVRVLGDRNLYQFHDIQLVPDWNTNWNQFYQIDVFVTYIFENYITWNRVDDPEQIIARQEALSMALQLTLWEFDALEGGTGAYLDNQKYAGRNRNGMPCALYINNLLFRAFGLPSGFWIRNTYGERLDIQGIEIVDKLIAKVSHDEISGLTFYDADPEQNVDGNAYVIVKGYQVGKDLFETIKPERFNLKAWNDAQDIWQKIDVRVEDPADPEGMTIVFDEPVIRSSNLVTMVDGYGTLNARPTNTAGNPGFDIPPVKATLTFAGEAFSWFQEIVEDDPLTPPLIDPVMGTQIHDEVLNVGGLNGEFISRNGLWEIPYADGKYCRTKAIEYANNFLKRQWVHAGGSFHVPLETTTNFQLHGKIDRVSLDYSPSGKTVSVQLTNEKGRINYVPERDLDRARQLATLFPGQAELKKQAEAARKIAATVRGSKDAYKFLSGAFKGNFTEGSHVRKTVVQPVVTAALPVGTPFAKAPNVIDPTTGALIQTRPVPATRANGSETQFAGLTVQDGETINPELGQTIPLQPTGVALARVKGPIAVDAPLTMGGGADYLVKSGLDEPDGDYSVGQVVGKALQAVAGGQIKLVRVHLAVAASVPSEGGGGYRGGWSNTATYVAGDIVLFNPASGQAGAYGCDLDPPTPGDTYAPDTGAPHWSAFPLQSPSVWA